MALSLEYTPQYDVLKHICIAPHRDGRKTPLCYKVVNILYVAFVAFR